MTLINTPEIEIWPASPVRARGNPAGRRFALAQRVLRCKRDGRALLIQSRHGLLPLRPDWQQQPGISIALDALTHPRHLLPTLPMTALKQHLRRLGLDADDYAARNRTCATTRTLQAGAGRI